MRTTSRPSTLRSISSLAFLTLALVPAARPNDATHDPLAAEVLRKRAHLAEVIDELSHRSVEGLTPAQVETRTRCLDLLRSYSERGQFPLNRDFPSMSMPYFVDQAGARCA